MSTEKAGEIESVCKSILKFKVYTLHNCFCCCCCSYILNPVTKVAILRLRKLAGLPNISRNEILKKNFITLRLLRVFAAYNFSS